MHSLWFFISQMLFYGVYPVRLGFFCCCLPYIYWKEKSTGKRISEVLQSDALCKSRILSIDGFEETIRQLKLKLKNKVTPVHDGYRLVFSGQHCFIETLSHSIRENVDYSDYQSLDNQGKQWFAERVALALAAEIKLEHIHCYDIPDSPDIETFCLIICMCVDLSKIEKDIIDNVIKTQARLFKMEKNEHSYLLA